VCAATCPMPAWWVVVAGRATQHAAAGRTRTTGLGCSGADGKEGRRREKTEREGCVMH
jgi:hypothetical protein